VKEPLVVHVYRGEEALGLLVPQRAAGVPRPSHRRKHYDATKKHQVRSVGSLLYTYDANGNMLTREAPANTITWSSANLPLVITNAGTTNTFSYGPNHDRWRLVYVNGSTTETTIYIGGLLEKWTRGTLTEWRHTIYAGGNPVALYTRQSGSASSNLTRYFHLDPLGSIETVTDSTNAIYVRERFTSYGQRGDPSTWGLPLPSGDATLIGNLSRRGYTFHESLGGATLNHMNGRVQDPILGRFLSADPYVPATGFTQAFNHYSYVNNNPLSYTDPSGYQPVLVFTWGCTEPHLCTIGVGVGVIVVAGEEVFEGLGDVLKGIGNVFKKIFGGLFGGGKPPPPKGCFVTNPVACTGGPGATRTPGFNPVLGMGGPSATLPGQATTTARGSSRVCTSWETCRDWILRNINRPDFFPRGAQNKTELAVRTAAFLRVATQELGKEIGISIVIDPRTSRYYLDPRTLIIGDPKPLDSNKPYTIAIAAGWFGRTYDPSTYVGDIHSHPDDLFGVHSYDQEEADRRRYLFSGNDDFDAYVVTKSGVVCRYNPGSGRTDQVAGPVSSRPRGIGGFDGGCGP